MCKMLLEPGKRWWRWRLLEKVEEAADVNKMEWNGIDLVATTQTQTVASFPATTNKNCLVHGNGADTFELFWNEKF